MSTRAAVIALGVGMAVVLAVAIDFVSGLKTYFVMNDELTYVRSAMTIADELRPVTSSDPWFNSSAQLMPLLVAPVYAIVDDAARAFDLAHVVLAVAFVSAAIPVFVLMRRVSGSPAAAALVAVLSIAVPWLVMTAGILTEPVAYAAFCWALLAMLVAVERRDARGDLIGLAGVALAFFTRTHFVVLAAALVAAALLHDAGQRRRPADIARSHAVLLGVVVVAALALAVDSSGLLGGYATVRDAVPDLGDALTTSRDLLAGVALGAGALPLPLAIGWIVLTLVRPASRRLHAFAAVAAVTGVTLVVTAGAFSVGHAAAPNDRYLMYAVPLLLACAVLLLLDRRREVWPFAVGGAVAVAVFATSYLETQSLSIVSPAETFRKVVNGRSEQLAGVVGLDAGVTVVVPLLVALGVAAIAVAVRRGVRPPVVTGVVGGALLVLAAGQTGYALDKVGDTQAATDPAWADSRSWVDRHVPDGAHVSGLIGAVGDGPSTVAAWWDARTFNRAVDRVHILRPQDDYGQPYVTAIEVAPDGRIRGAAERPHVLISDTDARLGFRGARVVARDRGMRLLRVDVPYRAAWWLRDADGEGRIPPGEERPLLLFGDGRAGRREVTLTVAPAVGAAEGGRLTVRSGTARRRVTVPAEGPVEVSVPAQVPARGSAALRLRASGRRGSSPPSGLRLVAVRVAGR